MNEIKTLSQLLNALSCGYKIPARTIQTQSLTHSASRQKKDERHFCISLAGHIIAIDSLYSEVFTLCKDYLSEEKPELRISINDDDLESEHVESKLIGISHQFGYIETLVVYRKICEAMLAFNTFLMHGAVISLEEKAYMFTAESGTGKTTHIKKWIENDERTVVVNGDKPLIQVTDTKVMACGTPWNGKEHMGTDVIVPLKAIILMERAEENLIKKIQFGQAFSFLLQQTYRPTDEYLLKKTISLLACLSSRVVFYKFHFNNLKEDSFHVAYETLTGNKNEDSRTVR